MSTETYQRATPQEGLQRQDLLLQLLEELGEGVACLNAAGRILSCNERLLSAIGVGSKEVLGKTPAEAWNEQIKDIPQTEVTPGERIQIGTVGRRMAWCRIKELPFPHGLIASVRLYRELQESAEDALLRQISDASMALTGNEFFEYLMKSLATALDANCTLIGELLETGRVRSLAFCLDGVIQQNFEYNLTGAPCQVALKEGMAYIPRDAWQVFPDDKELKLLGVESYLGLAISPPKGEPLGLICVMHRSEHPGIEQHVPLLRFFASRAAGELERLRATRLIEERQSRLSAIVDTVLDAIVTIDERGNIESFNPAAERLFGYDRAEAIGRPVADMMPQVEVARSQHSISTEFRAPYSGIISTGRQVVAHRKDGSVFPASITFSEVCAVGERFFVGVIRDLTDIIKAEESTRTHVWYLEGLNRVTTAIASTSDVDTMISQVIRVVRQVFFADRAWLIYPCDPTVEQAREMVEDSGESYPGVMDSGQELPVQPVLARFFTQSTENPGAQIIQTDDLDEVGRAFSEKFSIKSRMMMALRPRVGLPWLLGIHQCSARRDWLESERRLFADSGYKITEALSNLLLIREQAASDSRFRTVVSSVREGLFQTDLRLAITYVNPAWEHITGYTAADCLSMSLLDFVAESHRNDFADRVRGILDGSDSARRFEVRLARKDDRETWIEIAPVRALTNTGSLTGLSGTIEDITERRHASEALLESERQYRQLVELSPLAMIVVMEGDFRFLNRAALRLIGAHEADHLDGRCLYDFIAPKDRDIVRDYLLSVENARNTGAMPWDHNNLQFQFLRMDQEEIDVEGTAIPVRYEGQGGFQIVVHDVTARKRADAELRRSEERYALAAQGANDGLWDWDLQTDIVYYSPRWMEMLGLEPHEVTADRNVWIHRIHPDDYAIFQSKLDSHLKGSSPHLDIEHRVRHRDGTYRWIACRGVAVFDQSGRPRRLAGSIRDITDQKQAQQQLVHNAFHDVLTGLANRALFLEHLERSLAVSRRRAEYLFAILFIDFDRFKVVNDSLGHIVGDKLLNAITQRLKGILRPGDLFARLGGDEFAILIDDIRLPADAKEVADRIHQTLGYPFEVEGHEIFTSASIGIAYSSSSYRKPEDLLRDADTAMYRAKAQGRARNVIFDSGMRDEARELMRLEMDLNNALRRDEFEVYYQPICDGWKETICGFEALVRWNHPVRGLVEPEAFIPLAEETGIISQIGFRVLRESCERLIEWRNQFEETEPLFVAVNISARQFMQADFCEEVESVLDATGMPANRLKLELTESILITHPHFSIDILERLRRLGVLLCINDFGIGFSSLNYLHRLPLHSLKIDRSFTSQLPVRRQRGEIVPTIINLAKQLDLEVIAEGVETEAQLQTLRALGCDYVQGYLFSRPVPADQIPKALEKSGFKLREHTT